MDGHFLWVDEGEWKCILGKWTFFMGCWEWVKVYFRCMGEGGHSLRVGRRVNGGIFWVGGGF